MATIKLVSFAANLGLKLLIVADNLISKLGWLQVRAIMIAGCQIYRHISASVKDGELIVETFEEDSHPLKVQ